MYYKSTTEKRFSQALFCFSLARFPYHSLVVNVPPGLPPRPRPPHHHPQEARRHSTTSAPPCQVHRPLVPSGFSDLSTSPHRSPQAQGYILPYPHPPVKSTALPCTTASPGRPAPCVPAPPQRVQPRHKNPSIPNPSLFVKSQSPQILSLSSLGPGKPPPQPFSPSTTIPLSWVDPGFLTGHFSRFLLLDS
jgi:hypothetical protein